jgi:hypothetical protein
MEDRIYIIQMEQKIPSCMKCGKNPGKVTYTREYKTNTLLIVCDECLKGLKILGRDVKIQVTEEESKLEVNLGRYVEVPCMGCPNKTVKVLREYYDANKAAFDELARQRNIEVKMGTEYKEEDYIEIGCDYCPTGKLRVLKAEYEKHKDLFDRFHKTK